MKRPLRYICISLISILIVYTGCEDYGQEILSPFLDPNEILLKDTCAVDVVLFQQQILPVVVRECASSGCHDSDSEAAGINLDNYQSIIQLISTDDTTQSRLWKVFTQDTGDIHQPPLKLESVTSLELQQISNWISQGGLNTNCESYCEFTEVNLSDIELKDHGTPDEETDDYYAFSILVKGANLSSAYILKLGTLDTVGVYNKPLSINLKKTLSESSSIILTLTDTEKKQCVYSKRIKLPDLETPVDDDERCVIMETGLNEIQCHDNGTPDNTDDDFISFYLEPTGEFIGEKYILSGDGFEAAGSYGQKTEFITPAGTAGNGNIILTLSDEDSSACSLEFTLTDPGVCMVNPKCNITQPGLSDIQCNDHKTPDDPSDDFISFTLNPTGTGLSDGYTIRGEGIEASGLYGEPTTFNTPAGTAGEGDFRITLADNDSTACMIEVTITDPGVCDEAPSCNFATTGLTGIQCNNNNTPRDPSDDFISFILNPNGTGLSEGYTLTGAGIDASGIYGENTTFTAPAGSAGQGDLALTLMDNDSASCMVEINVTDPGNCAETPACEVQQTGLANIQCNDNETPNNPEDDFITFTLNPTGNQISDSYTVSGEGIEATGNYGQAETFGTTPGTAGNGDITLTLTDSDSAFCSLEFSLSDPGVCTPDCNILQSGISDVDCNDNGTPNDPQDDFITFTLNPTGVGTGTSYRLIAEGLDETGNFGQNRTFATPPGTAGEGNIVLTITDSESPACNLEVTLEDPGVCTPPCDITQAGLSNIECNNNDTPGDPSDDYFTFTINASAGASTGNYSISGGGINAVGTYGQAVNVESPPGSAGKGDIMVTITDANNPACTASLLLVDRGTCSEEVGCNIIQTGINNIACDDNGTPLDNSDDFLSFTLNPTGTGLGTTYRISGRGIDQQGQYGGPVAFSLAGGSIGQYDIALTITDETDNTCAVTDTLFDPYTCEPDCDDVSNMSYSQDIAPILKDYCTSCHGGNNPAAGIDLSTYEKLKEQTERQRFYGAIIHDNRYSPMPPGGKLIPCEIKAIKAWIDQGAPNN